MRPCRYATWLIIFFLILSANIARMTIIPVIFEFAYLILYCGDWVKYGCIWKNSQFFLSLSLSLVNTCTRFLWHGPKTFNKIICIYLHWISCSNQDSWKFLYSPIPFLFLFMCACVNDKTSCFIVRPIYSNIFTQSIKGHPLLILKFHNILWFVRL